MKPFEYLAPSSLEEALDMLGDHGGDAMIMAGGTDLIPLLSDRKVAPEYVIHIDKLDELRYIKEEQDHIRIGPLVTMNEIIGSDLICNKLSALWQAAGSSGAPQVRNLGTIGGNLGTASPAGDMTLALIALGAIVNVASKDGAGQYAVEDFLTGTKKNALSDNQMITEIIVPALPANTGSGFRKHGKRKGVVIAFASVAAVVTVDAATNTILSAKIAMGALAPTPVVSKKYGAAIVGLPADSTQIKTLSELVKSEIAPRTGRATSEYRSEIACVLAAGCVKDCLDNLKQ